VPQVAIDLIRSRRRDLLNAARRNAFAVEPSVSDGKCREDDNGESHQCHQATDAIGQQPTPAQRYRCRTVSRVCDQLAAEGGYRPSLHHPRNRRDNEDTSQYGGGINDSRPRRWWPGERQAGSDGDGDDAVPTIPYRRPTARKNAT